MPGGASTSRTSWSSAPARTSFAAGAGMDGRGLPRTPAQLMQRARAAARRRRRRRLVARLRDQRAGARDAGRRPSSAPASCPARRSRSRSTSRPPSSAAAAATRSALESRELDCDGMIELLLRWIERYPDRLDRGPAGRGRPRRLRALHPRRGRAAADRRRRLPGVACAAGARGRRARRGQRGAAQAQPARHADARRCEAWRAARELGYAGIVSARSGETEDTTIVHLAIGWGVGPAQGRLVRARRAHGEVERGAAHRGAARGAGALCRRRRVRQERRLRERVTARL